MDSAVPQGAGAGWGLRLMQYLGGKERIAGQIAGFLQGNLRHEDDYIEPFVGGASVISRINHPHRTASDANAALICMWRSVCDGSFVPPGAVTESEYRRLMKDRDTTDPMTAFVGFGCSFGGKWFGGFARSGKRNYASNARNSVLKKAKGLSGVHWIAADYRSLRYPERCVVYCDPPYDGVQTGYDATAPFSHEEFWEFIRSISNGNRKVFISSYAAPSDFDVVFEEKRRLEMHSKTAPKTRVERIFRWSP